MKKSVLIILLFLSYLLVSIAANAQQDRFILLEQRLRGLSQNVPGLNEKIETSVSNGTLSEFLKGLASTHNLNLNIDPTLTQRLSSYFSNEKTINVLVYLAKQYNLDFSFTGSIISVLPYKDPLSNLPPKPKELQISFNQFNQSLDMDLQEDSLLIVAKKITQVSNSNIVVLPELLSKKVTGFIKNLPIQNALEKLAISNGFKLNKTKDDVYILEALKPDEEIIPKQTNQVNDNYAIRKSSRGQNNLPVTSAIQVNQDQQGKKLITLNVTNSPILEIIKNVAEQAGLNYFLYSEITGNTTASVQNMEFDKVLNFVLQGTRYTFNNTNGVYMIGERKDEGLRTHQLIQLKYRSVDSLVNILPKEITQEVEIKEFKELNSILLSGSQPQINEIEKFVRQLDRTVPMVMIEVILMDVKKTKTIQTGLKLGVADSVKSGGTLVSGFDYTFNSGDINRFINQIGLNNVFNIGRVAPNFYASLKALESNNNVDLRQTPKLSTLNGHSASLSIGSTRYYAVQTQNVLGSLNPQTVITQQFFPVEASLAINILPFVSGDEQVTLNIDVNISDFIGNTPINVPPPSASSKFRSIIRVKNEEMIVLGGIERNEKSEDASGTPFLSRIPVLKWLFSSRSKTNSKTVSVVFIKPTIIY